MQNDLQPEQSPYLKDNDKPWTREAVTGERFVNYLLDWEDAFMRSLFRLIPLDPLSAFSGHPWHDELSKTKVIKLG